MAEPMNAAERAKVFKTWLKSLPREYLLCRSGRLHTFPEEGYTVKVERTHYVQVEICSVCKTVRTQRINKSSGYIDRATYARETEKYDVPKGLGRLTRTEYGAFRLERIERFLAAARPKNGRGRK